MPKHKPKAKGKLSPLYGVLCPSYGRPEMLANMLNSLQTSCTIDPRHVQVLIKIDDDDSKADGYRDLVDKYKFRIKILQAPQRGYFDNAKAYNLMFEHVISPIIWILNDDIIINGNWCAGLRLFDDISTRHYKDGIVIGTFQHRANFPIVRTDFCKKIGMLTLTFGVDGFLTIIARMYRRMIVMDDFNVHIHHEFPPPTMFSKRSSAYKPAVTKGYDYDLDAFASVIKRCDKFFVKAPHHRSVHRSYRKRPKPWPICEEIRRRIKK